MFVNQQSSVFNKADKHLCLSVDKHLYFAALPDNYKGKRSSADKHLCIDAWCHINVQNYKPG